MYISLNPISRYATLLLVLLGLHIAKADEEEAPSIETAPIEDLTAELPDMTYTMVQVRAATIEADRFLPWRNASPSWKNGYGIAVRPGIFLVPETLTRNNSSLQVRRADTVRPVPAEVIHSDSRVGLALIRASEEDWFEDAKPLPVANEIPQNGDFTIVQWGANDHLQVGAGTLLSIGYDSIGDGIPPQLTYELASTLRVSQPGVPILHNGKLAGISMQFRGGRRAALILSPDSITRFLAASEDDMYTGIPEPDFSTKSLADPVRRRFLGVPETYNENGVYVMSVFPNPDREHGLQTGDVILYWDGQQLDARGNYEHEEYGRIPFDHLVARRSPGEAVTATIVRDREKQDVEVELRTVAEMHKGIPENETGKPDDYVVSAGLIFRELTIDFLKAFGDRWERQAEIDLTWHAYTHQEDVDAPLRRTVILVGVLADPINVGYRELRNKIVTEINGQPIENLHDLSQRLDEEGFTSVTFEGMEEVPLQFVPDEVQEANQRIQQRFQIPEMRRLTSKTDGHKSVD